MYACLLPAEALLPADHAQMVLCYGGAGDVIGATLMHKLAAFSEGPGALSAPLLPALIAKFRDRVQKELPDVYHFFPDSSLHVTLRALTQ